jgi:hypothetical protein
MSTIPKQLTPEIVTATEAYLLAKVSFITLNAEVTKVYNTVLQTFPLFADLENQPAQRILDHEYLWLSQDTETQTKYYQQVDRQLKNLGLKPLTMETTKNPSWPARELLIAAENHLIDLAAPLFRLEPAQITKVHDRDRFLDLIVAIAVTSPNFKSAKEILNLLS